MNSRPDGVAGLINPDGTPGQEAGDERRFIRDRRGAAGTDGARGGLSDEERAALATAWLAGMVIVLTITAFDILTRHHNYPQGGLALPAIDEGSSAAVTAVAMALPAVVAMWMRRRSPPWWKAVVVHALAGAIYPVLHVAGFVALRKIAYPLFLGSEYRFGPLVGEFLYEAGKDIPAYALAATAFWLILRWRAPATTPEKGPATPAWFDIRDGARLVRVQVGDILAVRSAGNYAEFVLSDGRRPLMRTSLGGLHAKLAPLGFVRTHRSWLVNAARVTGLRPEGSGDYAVELGALEAPLSRRFRETLEALRR